MRSQKILLLCVTIGLLAAACSQSGSRSASLTDDSVVSNLVLGTYSTGCRASGPVSSQSEVVITTNVLKFTSITYDDGACAQPRLKFYYENTYVDVAASTVETGARNINITMGKIYYTPLSTTAANDSNGWTECGFSDWAINVTKDVSATVCQDIPLNTLTYTIARTANDQFEMGMPDPSDLTFGSTDNLRITNFVPVIFNKQ